MRSVGSSGIRRELAYLAELTGITAIVVAQPVFNVIQAAPEELVARGAGPNEIVAFALIVALAPPLLLWAVEQPLRLIGARVRDIAHGLIVGGGIGLFVVEVVKSAMGSERRPWLTFVGLAVAALAAWLLVRTEKIRSVLRYLAFAAPAFLVLFLVASPVADLVLSGSVDPSDADVANPVPVVVIAFDEFPLVSLLDGEGNIDAAQYPAFADLAGDSTWFRNNTGVAPLTPSALPAILTGELPDELFPAPVATKFNENLFTLLGGTYDVDVVETLTELCPPSICEAREQPSSPAVVRSLLETAGTVFGSVAKPWADQASLEFVIDRNPSDPQAPERLRAFGQGIAPGDRPTLDFGHFLLPHQPWDWLASGRTYTAPDPPRSSEFGDWHDQTTADEGRQRHLLQLQYTDALLGEALANMRASGVYEDALVIVTADHGVGFVGGEPLRAVSEANYHQIMWTPLFVKRPGQTEGEVDDRTTETIDIVPTVADVLNVEIPWEVDGASVFEEREDRPARMIDWRFNTVEPEGDFVVLDRDEGFARVLASSNPAAGTDGDPDAMLRLGEYGPLIGTPVSEATVGAPVDVEAATESHPTFTVARDATDLPAYVEGLWAGAPEGWIAVAVDGTVAGIGRSYEQGEFSVFWTMLAERLLTPGGHALAFYTLTGPVEGPTFHPLAMAPPLN